MLKMFRTNVTTKTLLETIVLLLTVATDAFVLGQKTETTVWIKKLFALQITLPLYLLVIVGFLVAGLIFHSWRLSLRLKAQQKIIDKLCEPPLPKKKRSGWIWGRNHY